ncbi:reverse transcriptase [Gossypium australe]|uniref:Reverse transcriptase n=1 Tax=Gossypium australe TaxID=47621 RepID=A0A5B6X0D8_9ROSI|nr:reverse transcriptase [Gossypium australe]
MVVKLDLEKAYDRISWDFIDVTLVAAGIPEFLRKVIMGAISSSSMQILWNGVPSQSFKPKVPNLRRYLGMPLLHDRVTKSEEETLVLGSQDTFFCGACHSCPVNSPRYSKLLHAIPSSSERGV